MGPVPFIRLDISPRDSIQGTFQMSPRIRTLDWQWVSCFFSLLNCALYGIRDGNPDLDPSTHPPQCHPYSIWNWLDQDKPTPMNCPRALVEDLRWPVLGQTGPIGWFILVLKPINRRKRDDWTREIPPSFDHKSISILHQIIFLSFYVSPTYYYILINIFS